MVAEFVTVRSRTLSLWQSAVDEVSRRPEVDAETGSLMRKAAGVHARAAVAGLDIPSMNSSPRSVEHWAFLSKVHYEHAEAARLAGETTTTRDYWPYSNDDPAWIGCEAEYLAYYYKWWPYRTPAVYHDWKTDGKGNRNYSVIPYTLPANAKVLIIGDWGTGQEDAATLLTVAIKQLSPTAVIHLGDVYYSGTPDEAQKHVIDIFEDTFKKLNMSPIPVFTMCGNHDYYSGGQGFYNTIANINSKVAPAPSQYLQEASYFCLRTADGSWQFLAMDTGWGDQNPWDDGTDTMVGPILQTSEVEWHQDKLNNFNGYTILLSHHQLFSSNSKINAPKKDLPYVNKFLIETFEPYFYTIGAWIWGHEHNLAAYANGTLGLAMGRLIGNSAYEETLGDGPYTINYPKIKYADNMQKVSSSPYGLDGKTPTDKNTYYNHSVALIDFKRPRPTSPLQISYYQFPSWPNSDPPAILPAKLAFMYSEDIPPPPPVREWSDSRQITTPEGDPKSTDFPSLTFYLDKIFMAYKGTSSTLYYSWYEKSTWRGNKRIAIGKKNLDSNHSPALVTYNDKLYLIYKHPSQDDLYMAWSSGGSAWEGDIRIEISKNDRPITKKGPTAAVFGNLLYIAYKMTSGRIGYAWYDGSIWRGNYNILSAGSEESPTLAVYTGGGAPVLYAIYRGKSHETLYTAQLATPGGTDWTGDTAITIEGGGTAASKYGAGLAQVGNDLVALYAGKSDYIYWAKMIDGVWTGNVSLDATTPVKDSKSNEKVGALSYYDGLFMAYKKPSKDIFQAQLLWKCKKLVETADVRARPGGSRRRPKPAVA